MQQHICLNGSLTSDWEKCFTDQNHAPSLTEISTWSNRIRQRLWNIERLVCGTEMVGNRAPGWRIWCRSVRDYCNALQRIYRRQRWVFASLVVGAVFHIMGIEWQMLCAYNKKINMLLKCNRGVMIMKKMQKEMKKYVKNSWLFHGDLIL